MFTARFIRVPVKLFSQREKDLTGKSEDIDAVMCINPFDICCYRPTVDTDYEEQECVNVRTKDGSSINVYMTMKQFEDLLNNHHQ